METMSRIFSAVVLSLLNLLSVAIGFVCYKLSGSTTQLAVQGPVALLSGLAFATTWIVVIRRRLGAEGNDSGQSVVWLAFPFAAMMFSIAHFAVTGYLTSLTNITAVWGVQIAQNFFGLVLADLFVHPSSSGPRHRNGLSS